MSMSIYITQIELATGSFDGPAIYARCWSDAQYEADHLGVTLLGRLEGEDEAEEGRPVTEDEDDDENACMICGWPLEEDDDLGDVCIWCEDDLAEGEAD